MFREDPPKRHDYFTDKDYQDVCYQYEQRRKYDESIKASQVREKEKEDLEVREKYFLEEQKTSKKRIEYELSSKQFIALGTLAAASITLLIQHVFDALARYTEISQLLLKVTLVMFAVTLICSVGHNYLRTKLDLSTKMLFLVNLLSIIGVSAYIFAIIVLVVSVLLTF